MSVSVRGSMPQCAPAGPHCIVLQCSSPEKNNEKESSSGRETPHWFLVKLEGHSPLLVKNAAPTGRTMLLDCTDTRFRHTQQEAEEMLKRWRKAELQLRLDYRDRRLKWERLTEALLWIEAIEQAICADRIYAISRAVEEEFRSEIGERAWREMEKAPWLVQPTAGKDDFLLPL